MGKFLETEAAVARGCGEREQGVAHCLTGTGAV
jgi:hypothetical protein